MMDGGLNGPIKRKISTTGQVNIPPEMRASTALMFEPGALPVMDESAELLYYPEGTWRVIHGPLMGSVQRVSVTPQGQLTLPQAYLEQFEAGPGDHIRFTPLEDGGYRITPAEDDEEDEEVDVSAVESRLDYSTEDEDGSGVESRLE